MTSTTQTATAQQVLGLATEVTVGGLPGFDGLSDPTATAQLRATGDAGLYMHFNAMWTSYMDGTLPAIAANFAGTGPGEAELPFATDFSNGFLGGAYNVIFTQNGLHPDRSNVNGFDYNIAPSYASWTAYVDESRSVGIRSVAPVFSPNALSEPMDSFVANPAYDLIRSEALYGGGLALDMPPRFFMQAHDNYQTNYQAFVEEEIRWANSNGLRSTVIVSPYQDASSFLQDTQWLVSTLKAAGATPSDWVVENYNGADTANLPNAVGRETDPQSVTRVALWMAQNALVATPASAPSVTMPALSGVAFGQSTLLSGMTIADPSFDAAASGVRVTLTASHGTLAALDATDASASGSGSGGLTLTGSVAGLQAALRDISYTAGAASSDTLGVILSDSAGASIGSSVAFSITGAPVTLSVAASTSTQTSSTVASVSQTGSNQSTVGTSSAATLSGSSTSDAVATLLSAGDTHSVAVSVAATTLAQATTTGTSSLAQADAGAADSGWIVTASHGATHVVLGSGSSTVSANGYDTIDAGSGLGLVYGSDATVVVNANSGAMMFVGGSGEATVNGGTGSSTVWGSSAGGHYSAGDGGGSILVAGAGPATLSGAASGDVLYGSVSGDPDLLQAGAGSEILVAGNGATTLAGGTGSTTMFLGSGADTISVDAMLGGTALVIGFDPSLDRLALSNVDAAAALADAASGPWGETVSLGHGSTLVLFGIHGVGTSSLS